MASQQLEGRLSMTREDRRALTSHLYKVVFFTVRDEIVTDSEKKTFAVRVYQRPREETALTKTAILADIIRSALREQTSQTPSVRRFYCQSFPFSPFLSSRGDHNFAPHGEQY